MTREEFIVFRVACIKELNFGEQTLSNADIVRVLSLTDEPETIDKTLARAVAEKRGMQIVEV